MTPAQQNDHNYAGGERPSRMECFQFADSRCSTPIFDRRIVPHSMPYLPGENAPKYVETDPGYRDWKRRLQRKKLRNFKIRGLGSRTTNDAVPENNGVPTNCSIISGHFGLEVNRISEKTIMRPTPVHEMWFPMVYPGFWSPARIFYHQNEVPVPMPQLHPVPIMAPSTSAFFDAAANCLLPNFNQAFPAARCNYPGYINQYLVTQDPRKLPFIGPVSKPMLMYHGFHLPSMQMSQPMVRHLCCQYEPPPPTPTPGYVNFPQYEAN